LVLVLLLLLLLFTAWIHRPTNATTPTSGTSTQNLVPHAPALEHMHRVSMSQQQLFDRESCINMPGTSGMPGTCQLHHHARCLVLHSMWVSAGVCSTRF
jgi:hypothetical protein